MVVRAASARADRTGPGGRAADPTGIRVQSQCLRHGSTPISAHGSRSPGPLAAGLGGGPTQNYRALVRTGRPASANS